MRPCDLRAGGCLGEGLYSWYAKPRWYVKVIRYMVCINCKLALLDKNGGTNVRPNTGNRQNRIGGGRIP